MDIERYNRHLILNEIGLEGQTKLNKAKVLVVGAGGLGCPVLIYLAAAGIGKIGIVDNDIVSISNLQRQILYTTDEINQLKAEKAKNRLLANNPTIKIETYITRINAENAMTLVKEYDLIVDCTDNYESRYVIDTVSKQSGIPMIYGSISKFTGQVSVFNYRGSKSYKELFYEKPEIDEKDASRLGVLSVLPGIVGTIQANEAIKVILNSSEVLKNKLFLIDTRTMATNLISY